ncbi:ribokinase [Brevibacillus sp. B_LB10_24]|uniref:ribokinase n=1 Tax=Brevibacillus sp. B_LB10_24 TaxID=3380645 RepID=UPI0038BA5355
MKTAPQVVVIGSLNMDIVVEADRPPAMGETVSGNQVHFIPGGKGANQAVAAARLGAKTRMIGAVGDDAFGAQLLASLEQDGIGTQTVKTVAEVATGIASILLSQGDNSIIVVPGANYRCLPEDVDRHMEALEQADVILLQLEIPLETVVHAAKRAKALGKKVVLNPAPARELPDELYQHVDVIIPNETELALLSGISGEGDEQLTGAMKRLLAKGVQTVITTLGAQGAAYLVRGGQLGKAAGHKVEVVDTTGAGDSFNAGFAVALASGKSLAEAVSYAGRVAALAVTRLGAQRGMPTSDEVAHFEQIQG